MWQLIINRLIWIYSVCLLILALCDELQNCSVFVCFKDHVTPIFLFIVIYNWTEHIIVTPYHHQFFQMFHPLTYTCLVWIPCHQYWTVIHVHVRMPLSDCSWSGCALFAQVYICPNIWCKYSVLSCSKCDKYNNILIQVHCSNPQYYCFWSIICIIRPFVKSSPLLIKKSMWPH